MAIAGRKAQIRVSGAPVVFTNEATTANGTRTQYQITDAAKRVLDQSAAVSGQSSPDGVTWTPLAAGSFTVNRLTGTIVFATARAVGTQVQVSGSYLPTSVAAEAKEFSYSLKGNNQDASMFGDTYTRRQQGLKDVSGSLSQWTTTDRFFENALSSGAPVVLEFYSNASATTPDLRAWAIINSDEISAAADGLAETSVEWEATADVDGRSISLV